MVAGSEVAPQAHFRGSEASVEQHLQCMSASCELALQNATLYGAAGKQMASLRKLGINAAVPSHYADPYVAQADRLAGANFGRLA